MAVYSIYLGTTDISDYVVAMSSVPIVEVDYPGQITLASMSLTVINNAVTYAYDAVITIKRSTVRFARFIIEDIVENTEAGTKTLSLVDSLKLLERIYVQDLVEADYTAGMTSAEDYDSESRNLRFYWSLSSWPHKIRFVTLTHFIKSALVKAGISTAANIDCTALYGELESGFIYYNNTTEEDVPIYMEELCFYPDQIKYAKLTAGAHAHWDGATLLDVVLFSLLVMDAQLRYVGAGVVISLRGSGSAIANDARYSYQKRDYINSFDVLKVTANYVLTVGTSSPYGFGNYVSGAYGAEPVAETWTAPATPPTDRKISEKTIALMSHAIVHRREQYETHYALDELHGDAYALPNVDDYKFANQLASILFSRYPATGYVEQIETDDNPSTLGTRKLLKASIDVPNASMILEF